MMKKNIFLFLFNYYFIFCCYGNFGDIMVIKFKVEIDRYVLKGKNLDFLKIKIKKIYMIDDV